MIFRHARHTCDLDKMETFYREIVGLEKTGGFRDHAGYNGLFMGIPGQDWHLEFTTSALSARQTFDEDDILVFYVHSFQELEDIRLKIKKANLEIQTARNPYWVENGIMVLDPDGYRVVFSIKQLEFRAEDELTNLVRENGIANWAELIAFVKQLPYGRNQNRHDLSLVLKEGKGTCSSKHAFLKAIADANQFDQVKLILGMYKMNHMNTPAIGDTISAKGLEYIPEAHCYLKIGNQRMDITTRAHHFERLAKDIINETEISPEQVDTFKVAYHKDFLRQWMAEHHIHMSFEELWETREACIRKLGE